MEVEVSLIKSFRGEFKWKLGR